MEYAIWNIIVPFHRRSGWGKAAHSWCMAESKDSPVCPDSLTLESVLLIILITIRFTIPARDMMAPEAGCLPPAGPPSMDSWPQHSGTFSVSDLGTVRPPLTVRSHSNNTSLCRNLWVRTEAAHCLVSSPFTGALIHYSAFSPHPTSHTPVLPATVSV